MLDKVIFYNHFGNGDIFESREFVKEYMRIIPAKAYEYAHGKHPKILRDIPELGYTKVEPWMNGRLSYVKADNTLAINTWIGRDSKYVLPGIGCVVEKLFEMHNDILKKLNVEGHAIAGSLEKTPVDYIPTIDFGYYELEPTMQWLEEHKGFRNILISNGPVQSNQAMNFSFDKPIAMIASAFPDINFIITQNIDEPATKNIYLSNEIIKSEEPFDLNEIAFLSVFCDTIVGRNSGPHVFAQHKQNWLDPNKISLSFTYEAIASHFVLTDLLMVKAWSSRTSEQDVIDALYAVIKTYRDKINEEQRKVEDE